MRGGAPERKLCSQNKTHQLFASGRAKATSLWGLRENPFFLPVLPIGVYLNNGQNKRPRPPLGVKKGG